MIISQEIVLIMIYSSLFFFFWSCRAFNAQSFKLDIGQVLAHNLYY